MSAIVSEALKNVVNCAREGSPEQCARLLIAATDAVYAPLKPVDSGLGEARRIASLLAGILANSFLAAARERDNSEEFIKSTLAAIEDIRKTNEPLAEARQILESAGASVFEPAVSNEARETVLGDIKAYIEPQKPQVPRRRRQPRRPEPVQSLRRLLRELGRRDPMLAKQVAQYLRQQGVLA